MKTNRFCLNFPNPVLSRVHLWNQIRKWRAVNYPRHLLWPNSFRLGVSNMKQKQMRLRLKVQLLYRTDVTSPTSISSLVLQPM
ncbi:hypothetical protein GDO86_012015 [Hymenochirus boettgeri]|uniref:Uncharacterized protein n=1 Tax=Hymenochirus boettgeri TaxID=247094 RepID=A0A8T2JLF9_9PIPI|nr:hypothetical protein GDO86_012015 [Hymenochirus boettgeri]